ncbi:MAG: hypothetical protein ACK421_12495, partial [Pseudanabaenaceae cyanobacterium]
MKYLLALACFCTLCPFAWGRELLPELQATLAAIDQSASERNLDRLLQYFAPEFQSSDGMNLEQLRA